MTKSEKRYFRLENASVASDSTFMKLYDFLEKTPATEQNKLAELPKLFPGSSFEPARKHLYSAIMKSLRQYERDKNIEARLFNALTNSKILFNRGLTEASLQTLSKAKDLALKNEKFLLFVMLAQQELRLHASNQFHGVGEVDIIGKQETINRYFQQEISSHQHTSIYEILLLRYWKSSGIRTAHDLASLNDLLLEEHYILNNQALESFESRQIHLLFQSTFMSMAGDVQGSLDTYYSLDELFRQNSVLWAETPAYYIQALNGILYNLRRMGKYEEMGFFIERLHSLRLSSESMTFSVKSQAFEHHLHSCLNRGEHDKCLALIHDQFVGFEKAMDQLGLNDQAQLLLTVARVWLATGYPAKALNYVNENLNKPTALISKPLFIKSMLCYLMIHKELSNRDLLDYETRSYERRLKKEGKTYKTEVLVLSLIKNWVKYKSTTKYHIQLTQIAADPFEQGLISELALIDWFQRNS